MHDHGGIVWDEFVGIWLVLVLVPFHWAWWLAAFVAFRFFDVAKPWPIGWLDRRVGGGFGIMVDDLIAAIYAVAVLWWAVGWLVSWLVGWLENLALRFTVYGNFDHELPAARHSAFRDC